jgi:hypothetical protein
MHYTITIASSRDVMLRVTSSSCKINYNGYYCMEDNQFISSSVWVSSIRPDQVDKKYLNTMEKGYHLWAGIKEIGKDGKK